MTTFKADELSNLRALHSVITDLERVENRSNKDEWIEDTKIQELMGLQYEEEK
jgi:hypothetical protein